MSDFLVNIGYKVDSSEIKKAREEINKTNDSLGKTGKSADNASKKTSSGFKAAAVPIGGLTKVALGAGAALVAIGGSAAIAASAVRSEFAAIQEINDFSQILGVSAEELSILEQRAQALNVPFESVTKVLQRQQEQIANGNEVFEELGLNIDRLSALSPEDAFQTIINQIDATDDSALKARASLQLLGESEQEVIKLAGSFEELARQREEALGRSFSTADLAAAQEFDEIFNRLSTAATDIRREITRAVGPSVLNAAESLASFLEDIFEPTDLTVSRRAIEDLQRQIRDAVEDGQPPEILINLGNRQGLRQEIASIQDEIERIESGGAVLIDPTLNQSDLDRRAVVLRDRLVDLEEELVDAQREGSRLRDEQLDKEQEINRVKREQKETEEARIELLEQQIGAVSGFESNFASIFRSFAESDLLFLDGIMDAEERAFNLDILMSQIENRQLVKDSDIENMENLRDVLEQALGADKFDRFKESLNRITIGEKSLLDLLVGEGGPEKVIEFLNNLTQSSIELADATDRRNNKIKNTNEFIEDSAAKMDQQLAIAKAIEEGEIRTSDQLNRRVEIEKEISRLKALNVDLSDEEIRATVEQIRANEEAIENQLEFMQDFREFVEGTFEDVGNILSDSISDALIDGRASFADFFADVGELLIRSGIQELIAQVFSPRGNSSSLAQSFLGSLFSGLLGGGSAVAGDSSLGLNPVVGVGSPGFASADGNVFNGPATTLLGEQGPEAVLPLGRDASGRLGVRVSQGDSGGSQRPVVINNNVTVNDSGGNAQETAQRTSRALDQLMERKFKQMIVNESRSGNLLGGRR